MQLTNDDLGILLLALNDRENVLALDWENANRANSTALMLRLCGQLREVRALADEIANHMLVTKGLS